MGMVSAIFFFWIVELLIFVDNFVFLPIFKYLGLGLERPDRTGLSRDRLGLDRPFGVLWSIFTFQFSIRILYI